MTPEWIIPIVSGLEPALRGAGELSKERADRLDADLGALDRARAEASVASRTYVVGAGTDTP